MFRTEDEMQAVVDQDPGLILSGIPEINPEFSEDTPRIISLGREISLASGSLDNLFIDTNAILTIVECKRYNDARIKREVYPQALNYAADLQSQLIHYNGVEFQHEFAKLIASGQDSRFRNMEEILKDLGSDALTGGKNASEWRRQFLQRLEQNVKNGVCRVIILCAPSPENAFAARQVRNLMSLMTFSEQSGGRYDLILMDLREISQNERIAKIIWRRYTALPQIPIIAEYSRDTSAKIDEMKVRVAALPTDAKLALDALLSELAMNGVISIENTKGYALKWENSKKSLYVEILIEDNGWLVNRHQVRSPEATLFNEVESGVAIARLEDFDHQVIEKTTSSLGDGKMYEIRISPNRIKPTNDLVSLIKSIATNKVI